MYLKSPNQKRPHFCFHSLYKPAPQKPDEKKPEKPDEKKPEKPDEKKPEEKSDRRSRCNRQVLIDRLPGN